MMQKHVAKAPVRIGSARMKLLCGCAAVTLIMLGDPAHAGASITSFDACKGETFAYSIDAKGWITGDCRPSSGKANAGFVRSPRGTFQKFFAEQGATFGVAVSRRVVAGDEYDGFEYHGIVRAPDNTVTTFDPAGSIGTFSRSIATQGTITGYFEDASSHVHGFFRTADGSITDFDAPQANYTYAEAITDGVIVGDYSTGSSQSHGFIRATDSTFTTFDPPGSNGTTAQALNASGAVVGFFIDSGYQLHGYVRAADGTITIFDVPNAADGTIATGINDKGVITGRWQDNTGEAHGFIRRANGTIKSFDPAGSTGTWPEAINKAGTIAGFYYDGANRGHGFVRSP